MRDAPMVSDKQLRLIEHLFHCVGLTLGTHGRAEAREKKRLDLMQEVLGYRPTWIGQLTQSEASAVIQVLNQKLNRKAA